jgi:hypothetical protein
MRQLFTALLVMLLVAALRVASPGAAAAVPCSDEQAASGVAVEAPAVHVDLDHCLDCKDGNCVCPCCAGAGSAALTLPFQTLGRLATRAYSAAPPLDDVRAGITIRPVTGPPKLSA